MNDEIKFFEPPTEPWELMFLPQKPIFPYRNNRQARSGREALFPCVKWHCPICDYARKAKIKRIIKKSVLAAVFLALGIILIIFISI